MAGYTWLGAGRGGTPSEGMIYLLPQTREFVRFNVAWLLDGNEFVDSHKEQLPPSQGN